MLFQKFQLTAGFTDQEQRDQIGDLWELIPRKLRVNTDLLCAYFDVLQQVNEQDKLADSHCWNYSFHLICQPYFFSIN